MSARVIGLRRSVSGGGWTQTDIRTARYALGATFGVAVSIFGGWELAYLVPVLMLSFLAAPDKPPTLKTGIAFITIVGVCCFLAFQIGSRLIPYQALYPPFIGIVLFRVFYAGQRGTSMILVLFLLISLTVIPMVALLQPSIALFVAKGLFIDVVVSVALVLIVYGIVPSRPDPDAPAKPAPPLPTEDAAFRNAAFSTAVVLPLLLVFYYFELTGAIVLLVFSCILSSNPAAFANPTVGKVFVVANVLGGLIAILVYNTLVVAPLLVLYLGLVCLFGLVLGAQVFSGKPTGTIFGTAFSTILLITGSVTSSDAEAGSAVYARVAQITAAVLFVVGMFGLLNKLFPKR